MQAAPCGAACLCFLVPSWPVKHPNLPVFWDIHLQLLLCKMVLDFDLVRRHIACRLALPSAKACHAAIVHISPTLRARPEQEQCDSSAGHCMKGAPHTVQQQGHYKWSVD
eukprot:1157240-Pelagomonas_calceolata.AAC.2